jgi:DNA primase
MKKEETGKVYDRFRNRVMIPIRDAGGRVAGFSGRVLAEGGPKYMNSPDSPVFNKSRILYGLYHAKRHIVDAGSAILVEGQFDFLALYGAGIRNAVASQGTAFTPDHAKILKRYVEEVVMSFDSDSAGESAALRGLDALAGSGLRIRVLLLPPGDDPESYVLKNGGGAFKELVESAQEYFDFLMDTLCRKFDPHSEVGKARIASEFLAALAQVPNAVLREAYLKKLAERLRVSAGALLEELRRSSGKASRRPEDKAGKRPTGARFPAGEKEIVRLMIEDNGVAAMAVSELSGEDFSDASLRGIACCILNMLRKKEWKGPASLISSITGERDSQILSSIMSEDTPRGNAEAVARDCIRCLKKRNRKSRIRNLREEIRRMEKDGLQAEKIMAKQKLLMQETLELLKE